MEPLAGNQNATPDMVGMPQDPDASYEQTEPVADSESQETALAPDSDPISLLLDMDGQEAIRRVYQLAISAAKAKSRIAAMADRMDARGYHDALAQNPEARYAAELIMTRRELDTLAAERRRLNLEAQRARESGRPASIYEMQATAAESAMTSVALGMLLFLIVPSVPPATGVLDDSSSVGIA